MFIISFHKPTCLEGNEFFWYSKISHLSKTLKLKNRDTWPSNRFKINYLLLSQLNQILGRSHFHLPFKTPPPSNPHWWYVSNAGWDYSIHYEIWKTSWMYGRLHSIDNPTQVGRFLPDLAYLPPLSWTDRYEC